ncbi:MAG: hypothetical protein A2W00_11900 [Candidatus Eisenbacteria bacterium RBG_16_71_46]|nr:MAG: hypothetical protein A2W00_11900 [Candidatus Eisenbacteria bacterium RBG_16_71_46]OGF22707.1 MAG: hypothetical protein A2V63_06935 [Candidatus Eisenbacteria bacterium RBG_19FT_COMBO_70_11]
MNRPPPLALAALAVSLLAAGPAGASTKINGEYQLMLDLRKDQRVFPWDWFTNSNDNYTPAKLRIFSQPAPGLEAFFEAEALWNSNDNGAARPEFHYGTAHLRLRRESGGRGFDSYVFSRQDRFWVDSYLLRLVYGRGGSQGVRVDTWGFFGLNTAFIVSDYSDQFNPTSFPAGLPRDSVARQAVNRTDDAYIVRLRREFTRDKRLRLGFTMNRFEANQGDSLNHQRTHVAVYGYDARYRVLGTDVSLEYAESQSERPPLKFPGTSNEIALFKRSTGIGLRRNAVVQAEIRSVRLGTSRAGFLNVTPIWWQRGSEWQNAIGGPNRDETGFLLNTVYLLPQRAVTYTNNYRWYGNNATTHYDDREVYNEIYVEFVNGFTGKAYYRNHETFRENAGLRIRDVFNEWFAELQVESRLAKLVVEAKSKDIGRPEHKQLYSVETAVNLTDKLKVYNRFTFGNDASILRKGIFSQLQFRPAGNTEMYLQYGPDYIGGGSVPVDEGNLQGSGDQADIVKFIIKGNF